VKVGPGVEESIIGKRASVSAPFNKDGTFHGLWSEYFYIHKSNAIIFDSDISYERIGFSFVNPLTACGFVDTVRKNKTSAVVQNAAFGAVAKMFIKLCKKEGISTINLVRKEDQVSHLKEIGGNHVINTSSKDWEKALFKLAKQLNANIGFDCIGGNNTGKLLALLPDSSVLYHYGNLEFKKIGVDSASLIFKDKRLLGWWMLTWLRTLTPEERTFWYNYVKKDLESGSDLFVTKVSKEFNLLDIQKAIEYYRNNMSEGKVLLRPKF
jgi:NADPH2:quinone reductase